MSASEELAPGADDWYSSAVRKNLEREEARRASAMSAEWRGRRVGDDPVGDMRVILGAVRGIVRVHGVPSTCRVTAAVIGQEGAGAAGFEDAPASFEKPFMLIDRSVYETCRKEEVLDVYCGIGLHEGGHILHTREGYLRLARGLARRRRVFDNLWEDERVEDLVCEESPGFAPYIHSAKRALLERGTVGRALARWDELPDMDRVNLLITTFIRLPHLIDARMKVWAVVSGECVFDTLRRLFPGGPRDEEMVDRFAGLLEQLWDRLHALYANSRENPAGHGSRESPERSRRELQATADAEDRALGRSGKEGGDRGATAEAAVERLLEEAARLARAGLDVCAEHLLDQAIAVEESGELPERDGRRFGITDLEQLLDGVATIRRPLRPEEASLVDAIESGPLILGDAWCWGKDRRTVIEYPAATERAQTRYDDAVREVRGHIAGMKAVFGRRTRDRVSQERDLREGRIDRRRLARGSITDHIFKRTRTHPATGLAVGLLLDESGSMGSGNPTRAERALQACAMLVEALRDMSGIELEVYSHTSCGTSDEDCLVRYLYGRRARSAGTIGSYAHRSMNYDHQAIITAARLLAENTTSRRRILLVLSDGTPSGRDYGGAPAVRATRDAVRSVRRRGIEVLSIAIAGLKSEEIFGKEHVVNLTSLDSLVPGMRALMTRLVRRAGGGSP